MTALSIILIIGFIILISLILVFYFMGNYQAPKIIQPSTENMELVYEINSPWGWSNDSRSAPVDGPTGLCNIYTYVSNSKEAPKISFNDLNSCVSENRCSYQPATKGSCFDEDQIMASERKHICQGNTGEGVDGTIQNQAVNITSGKCLKQNGELAEAREIEQYYQKCTPSTSNKINTNTSISGKCPGRLSMISFGGTVCMSVRTNKPIQEPCNVSSVSNGFPNQLFRIQRADFDGRDFVENNNGKFIRIVDRKSGNVVSPATEVTTSGPSLNGIELTLVPIGSTALRKGYWWVLTPTLSKGAYKSIPQLVYIENPSTLPTSGNEWSYYSDKMSINIEYYTIPGGISSNVQGIGINRPGASNNALLPFTLKPFITYLSDLPEGEVKNNITEIRPYTQTTRIKVPGLI